MENTPDLTTEVIRNLPAIIMAIGSVITAIGVIVVGYWAYKTRQQLSEVETKVDGMTSELVAATSAQKMAEGQLAERDAERTYQDAAPSKVEEPQKVKIVKPDIKSP